MGAEKSLEVWQPLGEYFYQLRELTRHDQSLQELKTVINNRLHASEQGMYLTEVVINLVKSQLRLLEKQMDDCQKMLAQHILTEIDVSNKVKQICQIKCVGVKSVATLLAETGGFLLFSNARQLISFARYDVVENQSGHHIGKTRMSKKGNGRIRRIFYMPAFCVVRNNVRPFTDLYERTVAKHGIKMKSYVAVQKKLLTTIYILWKNDQAFNEEYSQQKYKETRIFEPI